MLLVALGQGAQIDVLFTGLVLDRPVHRVIAINQGDTVEWSLVDEWAGPNFTESYGGEWKSPMLTNVGDHFSYTFTNAGLFAYRTPSGDGTITVLPSTNAPPPIMINEPVDGFLMKPGWGLAPLATVAASETNVARVTFLLGTNVWSTVAGPPYTFELQFTNGPGDFTVTARLERTDGTSVTSAPVHLLVDNEIRLNAPRRLPSGQVVVYFRTDPTLPSYMLYKDSLGDPKWEFLAVLRSDSVFVDANAVSRQSRFYRVVTSETGPPP